ncbi:MAG TPA: transketolase C-terminal domain-containing protein, partial [Chondromyces sp.]|nr:transketolase C-terminal domain-containing protein [Chondromyces sp.]
SAIRDDSPIVFIEHKALLSLKGEIPNGDFTIPIGKADIKREGSDVTIITYGQMVHTSLKAAEILSGDGINAEVLDLRTLLPLDKEAIMQSVQKTNRVVIVHESHKGTGFGAEISSLIAEELLYELDAPIKRIAGAFTPIPLGVVEDYHFPTVDKVIAAVKETCQ